MAENQWRKVMEEKDLKEGVPVSAKADGDNVLLVRLRDRICACGSKCTHYGGPLSDGLLSDHIITCPWHNARFDVTTGKMVAAPALNDLARYAVKVENGQVYVGRAERPRFPKPSGEDRRTFLIVAAGAAGNAAAETLRREGFAGRILLITAEAEGPYDRPNLSKDFLAGKARPEWIPLRSEQFYAEQRIELLTNRRVTALDPGDRSVTFANGERLNFDRLLLATGGFPRRLTIPGTDLEGCFLLRSLADAEAIVAAVQEAERALVVGASFIGMEVAASLTERGLEVHVVAPGQVPMMRVFGERVGRRLQRLHEEKGVLFHLGNTPKEILGQKRVQAVVLSDESRIATDVVVAGIGIIPAVDYLQNTGLLHNGAVPVDGRLQTKARGIFAAGDIAIVPDRRTGEARRVEHWVVAERQGQHAARAMLGSDAPYDEVPFFWTKQYDASLKYVGFARNYDRIAYRGDVEEGTFLAGYYQNGVLKAAATLGRSREIIALGEILKAGIMISPDQFQDEGTDLFEFLQHE
ncbi:MAG: FAD-dependent oxidoreductase [Anaerolineae bacterium]